MDNLRKLSLLDYNVFFRVEMLGSRGDWEKLRTKFSNLNKLFESIKADIGLNTTWWDTAGNILEKLLDTYDGNPDTEWWKSIIVDESYDEFVVCGFSPEVGFSGWFMTDFLNQTFSDAPTGITSAPLTIRQAKNIKRKCFPELRFDPIVGVSSRKRRQRWSLELSDLT